MKDESPDQVGPDRNAVQPAKAVRSPQASATSKIPPERLTTAGSKVTHSPSGTSDEADAASARAKKSVRSTDEPSAGGRSSKTDAPNGATNGEGPTWLASGVATGFDGSATKTGSTVADTSVETMGSDTSQTSLFARDDEAQRTRETEGSPHRSVDGDRPDDDSGTSSADRSADNKGSVENRKDDGDLADTSDDDDSEVTPLRSAIEWIVAIGLAILAALFIKTFLLQAFVIPSGSMLPTLQDRDRVLVSKQTYRFVDIERGDVVVFDNPDWQPNEPEQLIKRVIGLPRDSVEVRDGNVIVNGQIIIEDYLSADTVTANEPRTVVPDDAVFVMGDNRGNSKDSRVLGPILIDDFTGHAFVRIWPPSRLGGL